MAETLREICALWLRDFLRVYYGEVQGLKQIVRDRMPWLMIWMKRRKRLLAGRERRRLVARLAAGIEGVLTGPAFRKFLAPFATVLGGAEVRSPAVRAAVQEASPCT